MNISPIAVVESRWWTNGNHSVRELFEAVAALHYDNPSAFYYDMFADRSSLQAAIRARIRDKTTEIIYVASHGDETNIGATPDTAISRAEFRNVVKTSNAEGKIKGLYFGTCLTGNIDTAKFLLLGAETKLEWTAGYRQEVDWIEGSAIDMVFTSKLTALYVANQSRKRGKHSSSDMAHEAASQLIKLIPGAHAEYGFNMYFRKNNDVNRMFS